MSILRSYYSRNNTIQQNSFVNTGRNPVTQLYFGEDLVSFAPNGFTRFIFDLDLDLLRQKIATGDISTGCTPYMTHTLTMTNTSSFDEMLLNDTTSDGSRRAESFDLILFRIPTYSGSTGSGQTWDEGVGFDYVDVPAVAQWGNNQAFSTRPSNWYQRTTITDWSQPGLHTQTFYQPFLQTTYDDLILDDRNTFVSNKFNKLYLYIFSNGDYKNLDSLPTVDILDPNGDPIPDNASYSYTGLTTCLKTRGVYEVTIPPITGYTSPCQFNDVWTDLVIDGVSLTDVENSFILQSTSALYQIGSVSKDPVLYGFDFSGIKQNEKILNTDVRKVMVTIKQAYTSQFVLQNIDAYYRVYVKEGTTEVQVQDWTQINRTPNEYYFIFDTRDKIPNQYYVDIQVNTSGEKDTYQRQLTFEIVNKK